jgi:hypothetical protein
MPDEPTPTDADDEAISARAEEEYDRGLAEGWDAADEFITERLDEEAFSGEDRPLTTDEELGLQDPADSYEEGYTRGWQDRLKKEGWAG